MFDLRIDGERAILTLDRPEARNAVPLAGWDVLAERVAEAGRSGARLLLLRGAGHVFCAGADLKDFPALLQDEAARVAFRLAMRRAFDALRTLPIPAIALIEGPCYGAGVALAMACDLRFAAGSARFAIAPAKMGISYPQEDVARLVALVGPGQAALMLFTARSIGFDEALRIGLVDGQADGFEACCSEILANDAGSLAVLKRGIALAAAGVASDEEQDASFDALFGSDVLARRLSAPRTAS